jgi:hypothetical protein
VFKVHGTEGVEHRSNVLTRTLNPAPGREESIKILTSPGKSPNFRVKD